jgi:hypothetical protein
VPAADGKISAGGLFQAQALQSSRTTMAKFRDLFPASYPLAGHGDQRVAASSRMTATSAKLMV